MAVKLNIVILCIWCLLISKSITQNLQTFYGFKNYTQLFTGNVNILLTAPHDGTLMPDSITTREEDPLGNIGRDTNTGIVANSIRDELTRLFQVNKNMKATPYMVVNNLHRKKMDPNRNNTQCCYNFTQDSGLAYTDFHKNFIQNIFGSYMQNSSYKLGLIIDVHCQGHPENWIELGYLLNPSAYDASVLPDKLASKSSLNRLKQASSQTFEELIRGNTYSFGAIVSNKFGYKAVPSPKNTAPGASKYYNGGQITAMYTSDQFKNFKMTGFQMELPCRLIKASEAPTFGKNLAAAIFNYYFLNKFDAKL